MPNYFNFNNGEIITIMIMGGIFFLSAYGVPLAIYFIGEKKVKDKQENLYTIITIAISLQIVACVLCFAFIWMIDLYSRFGSSSSNFSTLLMCFYSGDWAEINVGRIAEHLQSSSAPPSTLGLLLMLKGIWIFLNIAYFAFPFYLVFKSASNVLIKHGGELSNGAIYEVMTEYATVLFAVFFMFAVHMTIPSIFLNGMYSQNQAKIASKVGSSGLRDHTYRGIAGNHIKQSIDEINTTIGARN